MQQIRQKLIEMSEEDYKAFSSALIPGGEVLLGVRLPKLRKLAKDIAKGNWRCYLREGQEDYFEEILLKGIIIGCAEMELPERLEEIGKFIPKITNWSVCDSFCISLKAAKEFPDEVWKFITPYLFSKKEFEVRFALVMILDFFIDEMHIDWILSQMDKLILNAYYSKMAAAWAISICFVKFPEKTMKYLKNNKLDDFTYHKALSKITESLQVDKETKKKIKEMKRNGA